MNREDAQLFAIICLVVFLVLYIFLDYSNQTANRELTTHLLMSDTEQFLDINRLKQSQMQLETNQFEANCNQRLAERFFDNMIIELILENDLNVSGVAYQQHQIDLNYLESLGCWRDENVE